MSENRILFLDAARTYAILLALGAHALHVLGVPDAGTWITYHMFFTSMAAPMFIFMFGVMMEVVYARRVMLAGLDSVKGRLFRRAYQCYLAAAFVSLAATLGGIFDWGHFFGSLFLVEKSRYSNILFLYAGALLLMPLIIRLRLRYGSKGLLALFLTVCVAVYWISFTKQTDLGFWHLIIGRTVGAGTEQNISVLAGLIFITMGMIAGKYITRGNALYLFAGVTGGACLAAAMLVWGVDSAASLKALLEEYAYGRLRSEGNIIYFLMGSFYSLAALSAIKFVVDNIKLTHGIVAVLSPLGTRSLLAFTAGNMALNLWHPFENYALPPSLTLLVFFSALWLLCKYAERMPTYDVWFKLFNPSFRVKAKT